MTGRWMSRLAALGALALLAGCVSIPTSGGVSTVGVDVEQLNDPLVSLPASPTQDASPEEIVADFLRAGRGPQDDYRVAREYLTDEFSTTWSPSERTLISSTPISAVGLADNTWSVSISATAAVDGAGLYQTATPADPYELTFGLLKDNEGQWRINSAPDGTVLPPTRFASIYAPYEVYFFDPSFEYLVPDLRWFRSGPDAADSVVRAMLTGPSERLGEGALFSAFPSGVRLVGVSDITNGLATVPLSTGIVDGSSTTHRRMEQQLLQSLRSVASVREVEMLANQLVLQVPDGGAQADSSYLVGNDPIGGLDGRVGVLGENGVTAMAGLGRAADDLDAVGGSIVSRDREAVALLTGEGVTMVRDGQAPVVIDDRSGLVAPTLDPLGYTWSVPGDAPSALRAFGVDGVPHEVPGLPTTGRVVSIDVSRDGARMLIAMETGTGPRLLVAGVQRDADLVPTALVTLLPMPIGSAPLLDAAWVDGVTVVTLTEGTLTSVDAYVIGGQHTSLGALTGGVSIVGGNTTEDTRVLDVDGALQRPGGGTSWQDTGIRASFLIPQQ